MLEARSSFPTVRVLEVITGQGDQSHTGITRGEIKFLRNDFQKPSLVEIVESR